MFFHWYHNFGPSNRSGYIKWPWGIILALWDFWSDDDNDEDDVDDDNNYNGNYNNNKKTNLMLIGTLKPDGDFCDFVKIQGLLFIKEEKIQRLVLIK